MTGIDARKMRKVMSHTISPLQLVGGGDRKIHHVIALARDAIHAAGKSHMGCGIQILWQLLIGWLCLGSS